MFENFQETWEKYGFEILVGISVLVLILYGLTRIGKKGTWTKNQAYIPNKQSRRPPQESKGEIESRRVLQEIFKRPFPKARPNLLNNPVTGGNFNLELDCFNSDLHLALEYNGIQHYKFIPFFHKNKEGFMNQKYRDELKRRICKDNGITLIEIPYTVKIEEIRPYIIEKLLIAGYLS